MISLRNYSSYYSSSLFNYDSSFKSYFYNNNNNSQSSYSNNYRSLRMLRKQRSESGSKRVRFTDEFMLWSAIKENDLNSFKLLIQKIDQKDVNRINQLGKLYI